MHNKTLKETLDTFSSLCKRKHLEYCIKIGHFISQSDYAVLIGVQSATFSQWVTQNRTPQMKQLQILQKAWGYEVFEVLGLPWLIPDDPGLHRLVEKWGGWSEKERQYLSNIADELSRKNIEESGVSSGEIT